MVTKLLTITNAMGFHMRLAAVFAGTMAKYPCKVMIRFNGSEYNAKSTLNIMAACIKCGSEIEIVCDGEQENEALAAAAEMIQSGFGE